MNLHTRSLSIETPGRGFTNLTAVVDGVVSDSKMATGLCTVFVHHTSCSLLVQENADPAVRADLEAWFSRLIVDGDSLFTHTDEGPDDMSAHVRGALTSVSIGVPVVRASSTSAPGRRSTCGSTERAPTAVASPSP